MRKIALAWVCHAIGEQILTSRDRLHDETLAEHTTFLSHSVTGLPSHTDVVPCTDRLLENASRLKLKQFTMLLLALGHSRPPRFLISRPTSSRSSSLLMTSSVKDVSQEQLILETPPPNADKQKPSNKVDSQSAHVAVPLPLSGDAMEAMWERLRGRPLRRSIALWRFFIVSSIKMVLANRTDDPARVNASALWVKNGLLRLGPTMIKLGQVFSSRSDLLHPAYIEALVSLQTAVPSVSGSRVRELLESELGTPLPFDSFEDEPIAGASLGQVHRGVYRGREVAIKVQRRNLEELFDTDFRNIRLMCRGLNALERLRERVRKWRGKGKSVTDRDWLQYAEDAARLLYQEIDYANEGRNSELFANSLANAGVKGIHVPEVIWETTTREVLTMEYVKSIKMTDQNAVKTSQLDAEALSQQVIDIFLAQLLQTGVLHCDPHPGNLCATPAGEIVLFDYGMLDTLAPETVEGLRKIAFSLFGGSPLPSEDELSASAENLVEGLQLAGFLAKGADRDAVQKVGVFLVGYFKDQYAGRATQDVTERVGSELQSLLDEGYISFPSAFTFVARAFTSVDGIARSLHPEYDFGKSCEPFIGRLITEEYNKQGAEWRESMVQQIRGFFGLEE